MKAKTTIKFDRKYCLEMNKKLKNFITMLPWLILQCLQIGATTHTPSALQFHKALQKLKNSDQQTKFKEFPPLKREDNNMFEFNSYFVST